jgi:hypothetical protein
VLGAGPYNFPLYGGTNPKEATVNLVKKLLPLGAVLATLAGAIWAAAPASAAPVYVKNGTYQFASNTGGPGLSGSNDTYWRASGNPLTYPQASQSLGATGVGLSVIPDSTAPYNGYADSGVIVPLGTIASSGLLQSDGSLNLPTWTGSSNIQANIYFDTNGDGQPFAFNSDGVYEGSNGDSYVTTGNQPVPASAVTADENPGLGTNTQIWAWLGIDSSAAGQTATGLVTSVNGTNLVSEYAAPVTGLKVTPAYTSLTATWHASSAATRYQVTVTQHNGSTIIATATVTGTSCRIGHLKAKNAYAVKVLALPAAPGQKPTTAYTTTK